MALASPSQRVSCRRVKRYGEQLRYVERQDGIVGAGIDQCPAERDRVSIGSLDGKRDKGDATAVALLSGSEGGAGRRAARRGRESEGSQEFRPTQLDVAWVNFDLSPGRHPEDLHVRRRLAGKVPDVFATG